MNILRHDFPSRKSCEYCHTPRKSLYEVKMFEHTVMVCSSICAERARQNWQEKIDKGVTPQQPYEKPSFNEKSDNVENFN